ncbi:MAG: hypothetical protein ABH852_03310 [Methanobacteriota archaeon]
MRSKLDLVANPGKQNRVQEKPAYCLDGLRQRSGVTLLQALVWNVGKLCFDEKGETQAETLRE